MRCTGNKKNDTKKFLGTLCTAVACDAEPSTCPPPPPTTTSTTTTTTDPGATTTTTTAPPGPTELMGALNSTTGRFNYNLTLGIAGANAACNTNFPGTHACEYSELLAAEAAGDLVGLQALNGANVNSLWAIDPTHIDDLQCTVGVPWDYQTVHTGQYGERVSLNNVTGDLGPLESGQPDNVFCAQASWVGCCL
jgi:hypothetical protein